MKQETHDNKTLDVVLGDFDLHGLILSEFKQSVKENPADLTLNNLSVLSPPCLPSAIVALLRSFPGAVATFLPSRLVTPISPPLIG